MATIIVVDDEEKISRLLEAELNDAGHRAIGMTKPGEVLSRVDDIQPDILITDLRMDEMDGVSLLKKVKHGNASVDVIMMTAYATVETALEAMREGAYDYIIKPFKTEELLLLVQRIEEKRRLETHNQALRSYTSADANREFVGSGSTIASVKKLIQDLAASLPPVLIRGESGTGKELVARAIHNTSARANGPFIAINCAAIPETLLESELFGYEKGAFTGANKRKLGHFQTADTGTLFLDEIGDLPASLQSKLLRVLENNRLTPLGGVREVEVDVRLVTATNRPLEEDIRDGRFREDLYYRINVFPIHVPPLRERREDIRELAEHFLAQSGRRPEDLSDAAARKLLQYGWPGNIRELRNVIERAVIVCPQGRIEEGHIMLSPGSSVPVASESDTPDGLRLDDMEKHMILKALRLADGNKSEAARLLGITRRTLYGRLERYGLAEAED